MPCVKKRMTRQQWAHTFPPERESGGESAGENDGLTSVL